MAAHLMAAQAMSSTRPGESAVFWIIGSLAVLAAFAVIFSKNAVHAALALAGVMVCLAIFYAMQDAPFLAVVQVVVYAGAVMSLFLFVVMLIGVDSSDSLVETIRGQRLATAVFGVAFLALLVGVIAHTIEHASAVGLGSANAGGNVQAIARLIFTTYFWPFEVISALLIIAALGAMVLAHHERAVPRPTQAELMRARFRGDHPWTPHSGPGVFAAGDAADRPALLPTGAPDEESVYEELSGYRPGGGDGRETTP